jgi:hypothetical protein
MPGIRFSPSAKIASLAVAGVMLSSVSAFAAQHHHPRHHAHSGVTIYSDSDAYYDEGNEAVFPNTEDHSTECINGYRWQRHNHDWFKTTAQDEMPLPCR